jgi:hypothetical protein
MGGSLLGKGGEALEIGTSTEQERTTAAASEICVRAPV